MSRLPVGLAPVDDVLVARVEWGTSYHRAAGRDAACGLGGDVVPHRLAAGHVGAMCGRPCRLCWPDPYGLAPLNAPYSSPAGARDRNTTFGAAERGPARTRATTTP